MLAVRSFTVAPDDLAAIKDEIRSTLAARSADIVTVDASSALVRDGRNEWVKADALFSDGIKAYGDLRYDDAVTALRDSLAISTRTYREYASLEGQSRVRETCLYLGLARLEQGANDDAMSWFTRAARTEPAFAPDEREFSPAARKAWADARASLSGAPMETSLEQLQPLAEKIGADVLVLGGVSVTGGRAALRLVIADAARGVSTETSTGAPSVEREELLHAVSRASPELVARVLRREVDVHYPYRVMGGIEYASQPSATIESRVQGAIGERYVWSGGFNVGGVSLAFDGLRLGPLPFSFGASFFPGQQLRPNFTVLPPQATNLRADVLYGAGFRIDAAPEYRIGRWTAGAQLGLDTAFATVVLQSNKSVAPTTLQWYGPSAGLFGRVNVSTRASVQLAAGAEYDLGGKPPGKTTYRAQLSAGTAF